jgi:polysaccharide export outer membrane protein
MKTKNEVSIFIIDDSQVCIDMYSIALNRLGYSNIKTFLKSADCLNSLVLSPKIVFLDYNMDDLNGIEILKKIKRFDPQILVVFISSQEQINVAVNALKYGAFDYIAKKDFNMATVKLVMEKLESVREIIDRRNKKSVMSKVLSTVGLFSLSLIVKDSFPK